jgi:diacylglycerol kinase family enzyme
LTVSDRPSDTDTLVASIRENGAELLVVAGGDGTTCHLLTRFAAVGALDAVPPLLVLPAGHVNTIASALVGSSRPAQLAQRILLAWTRGVRRLQRMPVLRVRVEGRPDHVGVTVSLGATARLHADYRQCRWQGAPGLTELLARLALQRIPADRFAPLHGPCELAPGPLQLPVITAGLISPLPGFFGIVRPFPGVRSVATDGVWMALSSLGPLASQAAMLGIVRGNLARNPHLQFGEMTRFAWRNGKRPDLVVLDGEEIDVPPGAEVEITVAARIRMLVWREMPLPAMHGVSE